MITHLLRKIRDTLSTGILASGSQKLILKDNHQLDKRTSDAIQRTPQLLGVVAIALTVTALVVGTRKLQWLERWELQIYDQMLINRPNEPADPRIVLVTITEQDLLAEESPLTDANINRLLTKVASYKPRVIGLDIHRPRQRNLVALTQNNLVTVCGLKDAVNPQEVSPPPNFDIYNVGFSNLISDRDDVVRRSLLFVNNDRAKQCQTEYSFAALLAVKYLHAGNDNFNSSHTFYLKTTQFPPLSPSFGSYENHKTKQGYKILINYRHPDALAREVSFTQVINDDVNPSLFRDKLVIIGTTADSKNTGLYTPYKESLTQPKRMHNVKIHAQIVSMLLSAALDGRSLIWDIPDRLEILWILSWATVGGVLALWVRQPALLLVVSIVTIGGLIGVCYVVFLQLGWIPVVPAAIAYIFTSIGVIAYTSYHTQQRTQVIILEVEKQREAIAQLNTLLNETRIQDTPIIPASPVFSSASLVGDRYQIIRVLGQGGFGCTYVAKDTKRPGNPTCVVKQLMPARRDPRFMQVARRLFDSEAEILEALGKHPQIPELLAYFEENQEFYLVQEYIQGHPLNQELPPVRSVQNESYVRDLLKGGLQVLAFVHQHRVIHRDIKPHNIIRSAQDHRLVLIDFGAVKTMQPQSTVQTELATVAIGTRGYTPPEQFAGHPRLSSDIYALGMIAIQALTGVPPQDLQTNPNTGTVQWRHLAPVNEQLAAILDKMVCYHFNQRYPTASEALEDLHRAGIG